MFFCEFVPEGSSCLKGKFLWFCFKGIQLNVKKIYSRNLRKRRIPKNPEMSIHGFAFLLAESTPNGCSQIIRTTKDLLPSFLWQTTCSRRNVSATFKLFDEKATILGLFSVYFRSLNRIKF